MPAITDKQYEFKSGHHDSLFGSFTVTTSKDLALWYNQKLIDPMGSDKAQ